MKLLKWNILCLSLLVSIHTSYAQHSVGITGGVNIPFVNFTDFVIDARYNTSIMTTAYGGISYRYQEHKNVGIQAELAYSEKGWGQILGENTNSVKNTISYIELPIYMRWSILGKSKFNIIVNAGCFVSYAIAHKVNLQNNNNQDEVVATYDLDSDNRGDYGFLIALGLSYNFSFGYIQVEGGYRSGFGNILPVSEIKKENPIVSTNQVPNLVISYMVPLHKFRKE